MGTSLPQRRRTDQVPTLEEVYEIIREGAEKTLNKFSPLKRDYDAEDVAHAYFADYVEKGFHDSFDPSRGVPISAWVGLGLRRWAIDRLKNRSFQFPQGDQMVFRTISGDQGAHPFLETVAASSASTDPLSALIVEEAMAKLRERERRAVEHRMEHFNIPEVAYLMGLSKSQVFRSLKKARKRLAGALLESDARPPVSYQGVVTS